MAKKEWFKLIFRLSLVFGLMFGVLILLSIRYNNWIPSIILGCVLILAIVIAIICETKVDKNRPTFSITKKEYERFKRESEECDKYAK